MKQYRETPGAGVTNPITWAMAAICLRPMGATNTGATQGPGRDAGCWVGCMGSGMSRQRCTSNGVRHSRVPLLPKNTLRVYIHRRSTDVVCWLALLIAGAR